MTGAGKTYARLDNRKICCTIRCLCTGFLSIPTTWRQDMKLLLTSVGSLVGRNILDVLDYPGFSRRSLMQLVGANSIADAAGNFRCDRCHLVPPTAAADYPARMQDILLREAPDLILCCRDEDTLALSQLKRDHPQLPGVLPVGTPEAALIGLDKWRTWQFACKHALPFAESFMPGPSGDGAALAQFCERVGYPLIAKPARGAGSRGVCFIRDADNAQAVAQRHGYLFQEYVGDPASLADYFESLRGPPPLFTQFKDAGYYLGYTVIAPSGAIADIAITRNDTEYGHTTANRRVADPALAALTGAYAAALFAEGGAGPMGVQVRRHGTWKAVEMNLRAAGGTLARFLRGVDELYLITSAFVPGSSFPQLRPDRADECTQVVRQYATSPILDADVATLTRAGVWSRR
jgi:hypothetical protein